MWYIEWEINYIVFIFIDWGSFVSEWYYYWIELYSICEIMYVKGNVIGINCKVYMFDIIEVVVEICVWVVERKKNNFFLINYV